MTELVVAYTLENVCPSKDTVVVSGTWYEESSPPQVTMVFTEAVSVASTDRAAAIVCDCHSLTQSTAMAGVAKNNDPKAIDIADDNLNSLLMSSSLGFGCLLILLYYNVSH
jgi:hypothetical protein